MNRLAAEYNQTIKSRLKQELNLKNIHQTPKLTKIVINSGVGKAVIDKKFLDIVIEGLTKISGQKPIITRARHSIAGFKLRAGTPIGVKVTLRGERMYNFLDRLIAVVLPRMRDFRGLNNKSFDQEGNYSIGIPDQTVFPEVTYEDQSQVYGLQVNLITNTKDQRMSRKLLEDLGLPFEKGAK